MIIPFELPTDKISFFLTRLLVIVALPLWKSRHQQLQRMIADNPLAESNIRNRYGIEFAIIDIVNYKRATGRVLWPPPTHHHYKLYALAAVVCRIYEKLEETAKPKFKGTLRSCLDAENGIMPFYDEVMTAARLMGNGYDVEFNDYIVGSGFDYLVAIDNQQFEVECKYISVDAGRKITEIAAYQLAHRLKATSERFINSSDLGVYLKLIVPDRLDRTEDVQKEMVKAVDEALQIKADVNRDMCRVVYKEFKIAGSPFGAYGSHLSMQEIHKRFIPQDAKGSSPVIGASKPGKAALVISMESQKPDLLLPKLYREMKDAAKKQMSQTLPGALVVYLGGIKPDELTSLASAHVENKPTGLVVLANRLMAERTHLYAVAFMSTSDYEESAGILDELGSRSYRERGKTYVFYNQQHLLYGDKRFRNMFETLR